MRNIPKYIVITVIAFIVSTLGVDIMPQLIAFVLLSAGCVYFIKRKVDSRMREKVIALFVITFLLQVLMSLFIYNQTVDTKYYGFSYKGDDYVYGDFGTIVGTLWRKGSFPSIKELSYYNLVGEPGSIPVQHFQLYNAVMFYLLGVSAGQILLIVNCFFHAAIIIPVYFICKNLNIKNNVMMFIFSLFLFWPSTFYGSLFNFKEPALLFSLFIVFSLLIKMQRNQNIKDAIILLLFCFSIYFLKSHLGGVSLMMFLYFMFFWKSRVKTFFTLSLLLLMILIQLLANVFTTDLFVIFKILPTTFFNIRHISGIASSTPYFINLFTSTYARTIFYLPLGFLATLFLPFFARPFSLFHIGATLESIFWWSLIPFLVQGLWIFIRRESVKAFPMLFTFFYWITILALTQGSMGTLIRQKSIIYYIGFIFIGLAIDRTLGALQATRRRV